MDNDTKANFPENVPRCSPSFVKGPTIAQLLEQKIIVSKSSQSGKDSYRRITINDPSTFDDQHIDSPDEKTECILQSDDPHNVPLYESAKCDFSIEVNSKYQLTSETQTPPSTFPEIPHISVIKDQTQQKVLRVEPELSAIKSHFKCELSTLNSKIESLTTSLNGALRKLENHPHKCCSIVEDNLLFLQKEVLSKDDIIKSLVETQTAILDSISNTASDKQTPATPSVSPNLREKQQWKHLVQHSTQQQIEKQQEQPMQQTQH